MSKQVYDHLLGSVPGQVAPSEEVRYWGSAIAVSFMVWALTYITGLIVAHVFLGSGTAYDTVWHGFIGVLYLISLGKTFQQDLLDFVMTQSYAIAFPVAMASSFLIACFVGCIVFRKLLKPHSNQRHLQGSELKVGLDAEKYAKRHSPLIKGNFDFKIGPLTIPKAQANKGIHVFGGTGGGKSVTMKDLYAQLLSMEGSKSILYDVKGDYTSLFKEATIVSPFDCRSAVWDMAHDLRTQIQIHNMASAFFPDTGKDKFFQQAGAGIFMTALLHVYHRDGTKWTINDLEKAVNRTAAEHLESALLHDPKTAMLISDPDSQTTASILATVASGTRVLSSLAQAWGDPRVIDQRGNVVLDKEGNPKLRAKFSLLEWMKDDNDPSKDWSRAPRHVILQGGPDKTLTRSYINAMLNVLTPEMISVAFPDNEHGRCIGIFLDEMPSLGKLDLGGLLDQGRSKGLVNVWGFQDISQLEEVYGPNLTKAMSSMVGNKIICQIGSGATRKMLAETFGAKQVVQVAHKGGAVAQEVGKAVVYEDVLTRELGKYTDKNGWGIKVLVDTSGLEPMLLSIPGTSYPKVRREWVRAYWTKSLPMAEAVNGSAEVNETILQQKEVVALQEAVMDIRSEHITRHRFLEDKKDYYKEIRAMRHGAGLLGLTREEAEDLLDRLLPKYVPPVLTSEKLNQGFIRS